MAVITISRELGSYGREIADKVAEILGYEVVDKAIITEVARTAQVSEQEVEQFDEQEETGVKAFLLNLLFSEESKIASETYPAYGWTLDFPYQFPMVLPTSETEATEEVHFLDRAQYLQFTQAAIQRLHQRGNLIILGRGGMMVLRGQPNVLSVRVFASEGFRVEAVMAAEDIDYQTALQKVRDSDRRRAAYLRRHYHVRWDDTSLYHVLVNAEITGVEVAMQIIAAGAKALEEKQQAAAQKEQG
jgi:cytidylate kinase